MNKKATDTVSAAELADLLSIPRKDVAKLAAIGVLTRDTAGSYRLMPSITGYCDNQRKAATGREAPMAVQRRRLLKAQADLAVSKAKIETGELVDAAVVEARWSGICRLTMAQNMAVPSRVAATLPHLSRGDIRELDEVIREKLTIAGTYDDESDDTPPV